MQQSKEIIYSMEADPAEKKIITSSSDRTIRVYNVEGTELKLDFEYPQESLVTQCIFLNRTDLVCMSTYLGEILIFKLENNLSEKLRLKIFEGSINSIASQFDSSSFKVFCGCSDGFLRVINFDTKFNYKIEEIQCHNFGITSISCNNNILITGGVDSLVKLFDTSTLQLKNTFTRHSKIVRDVKVAPTNEFNIDTFASCSEDNLMVIYSIEDVVKEQVIDLKQPLSSLAWSKSGFVLSVGFGEAMVKHFVPNESGIFVEAEADLVN